MAKTEDKNIHAGHRQRLRERIERTGLEGLQDHEVLEYLLFFTRPHVNTNPIAHRLLAAFGSLDRVFEAEPERLREVVGVGEISAQFLALIPALTRRYQQAKHRDDERLNSVSQVVKRLKTHFIGTDRELFVVMALDDDRGILCEEIMHVGSRGEVTVDTRRLLEIALTTKASFMIIAHNHLTRSAKPSLADTTLTHDLAVSMRRIEVELLDHLILCNGDDYYSFAEEGQI